MTAKLCACGRNARSIHCASCGSSNVYATPTLAIMTVDQATGFPIKVMMYKCRRCGLPFSDIDRAKCEAPEFSFASMKERRKIDGIVGTLSNLPFEERVRLAKEKLSKLQANRTAPKPTVTHEVQQADDFVVTPSDDVKKEDDKQ